MKNEEVNIEGFYVGYFSAISGNAIALLIIKGGTIVGTDGSANYDGFYTINSTDESADINLKVSVKPNNPTIQGKLSGSDGFKYEIVTKLPKNFTDVPFLTIKTELGPVNARFEKIRDIENNNV